MRVLAVAHYYVPENRAGAELMLHSMLRALVDAGHSVTVAVTMVKGAPFDHEGVRVVPGTAPLRDPGFDVVVSHLLEAPRAHAWARRYRKPRVQVIHNTNRQTETSVPLGWDLLVFNSAWISEFYSRHAGDRMVLHPPVDAAAHRTTPGDRVTLVNMIPDKGSEVFYALAERMPDVRFLAVEGGYLKHAQDRRDLPNVEWQDNTGDMRGDVYARTGVLLVPSSYESYGMVGVEALASGIPVVAHPTPGLLESLGDAGVFVDRDDVDGWESAVRGLLGSAPAGPCVDRSDEISASAEEQRAEWVRSIESLGAGRG